MRSHSYLKTQTALAHATGIGQSTIGRILRGDVDTGSENIKQIAKALGTTLEYIMFGSITVVTNAFDQVHKVPLIDAVDAKNWKQAARDGDTGNHDTWFACPKKCGPHTFAIVLKGESSAPKFNDGEVIFVDPSALPRHGSAVAIILPSPAHLTIKILVDEGSKKFAKSINPEFPGPKFQEISDDDICGTVIGKWVDSQ